MDTKTQFQAARMGEPHHGEPHSISFRRRDLRVRAVRKFVEQPIPEDLPEEERKRREEIRTLTTYTRKMPRAYRREHGVLDGQAEDDARWHSQDGRRWQPEEARVRWSLETKGEEKDPWQERSDTERALEAALEPFLEVGPEYGHKQLTPAQAQVVRMKYWNELSEREIARQLGKHRTWPESMDKQAKQKLKKMLLEAYGPRPS